MKTIIHGALKGITVIAALAGLFASSVRTSAVEGLQLSIQSSNVVLSWPCLDDGSESFIIQYRPTLDANSSWQTLETSFSPGWGTNMAYYVHSGVVQFSRLAGSQSAPALHSSPAASQPSLFDLGVPLAQPVNGNGSIVPLALYPPGYDCWNLLIYDPASAEWVQGSTYEGPATITQFRFSPMDDQGGGGDSGTNAPADPGFYRVVRVGPHLVGITNDTVLSGVVKIPVEAGAPDGRLVTLTLTENGSPANEKSIQQSPFSAPLSVRLDTTRMSNGVHQIAAIADWQLISGTNESDAGLYEADCPPVSIIVSNEILFPQWMPNFGELYDSLLVKAQTVHTDADWYLDVYDSQYSYIGTMMNHTYDGNIEVGWNLVGPYGESHTNDSFFSFVITVEYPLTESGGYEGSGTGSTSAVTPPIARVKDRWPKAGDWVVAAQHAWDGLLDIELLYAELNGFVGEAMASGLTVRPSPVEQQAFAIHYQDPATSADWATLRQALYHPYSRNFAYMGHGAPDGLGRALANTNTSILASEIAANLHTIPAGQTNRHGYRLVIIDGCSSANGTLPESFGIIHKENVDPMDYYYASMRRSAFAGWSADKWAGFLNSTVNTGHINFFTWLEYYLAMGESIKGARDHAAANPQVSGVNADEMKIFGCWTLTFWTDNN